MSDILKQIDQLVADKTFSLDALDGIKKIKDALIETEERCEQLLNQTNAANREIRELNKRLEENQNQINDFIAQEVMMKSTVAAGKEALYNAQKHEAVANAWKEALQTVFKPNTIRETIARTMPVAVNGSNGGVGYVSMYSDTSSVTREEG